MGTTQANDSVPPRLAALTAAIHGLANLLGSLAGVAVLALLVISTTDVVSRQLRGSSMRGAVAYSEVLLVLVALLSLAMAHRHGAHVSTDFVVKRLPRRASATLQAVALLAVIVTMCFLVATGFRVAMDSVASGEYRMGLVRVPLWPARIALTLGFAALALELLLDLLGHVAELLNRTGPESEGHVADGESPDRPARPTPK